MTMASSFSFECGSKERTEEQRCRFIVRGMGRIGIESGIVRAEKTFAQFRLVRKMRSRQILFDPAISVLALRFDLRSPKPARKGKEQHFDEEIFRSSIFLGVLRIHNGSSQGKQP